MPCYSPLKGYRSRTVSDDGKRALVFSANQGFVDLPVTVACGQCIGCRLERSRQWAVRCTHEAQMHENNSFITLTYDDEHLPEDGSLHLRDFQLFMKRLRERVGVRIRFYHCGEYGDRQGRPHYHACIFGYGFPDRVKWKVINENPSYRSELLEETWQQGFSCVGEVTFQSAAYVARYILKKITGAAAPAHYGVKVPEYTTMSRRPGIGKPWLNQFLRDVYPSDFVVVNGAKMRPPRFYDGQYEMLEGEDFVKMKNRRKRVALAHVDNNTPDRLRVRQAVQNKKIKQLPRLIE